VATERVDNLTRQQFKRLRITFANTPPAGAFALDGVTEMARDDHSVTLEVNKDLYMVMETAVSFGIADIDSIPVTLEEIFLAYYGKGNGGKNDV
jgi:ABC-2 type transport system ATP-binding protein